MDIDLDSPKIEGLKEGLYHFAQRSKRFILVTANPPHLLFSTQKLFDNVFVIYFEKEIDFKSMFGQLYQELKISRVTRFDLVK